MEKIDVEGLSANVSSRISPLLEDILKSNYGGNVHSLYIVGSALTPDFDEKISDINSVVVLKDMDLRFIEYLAPLGKGYKKKGVAPPLIMTPAYIRSSLDVFPIEFMDLKLIHKTVYGSDLLEDVNIEKGHLRLQCERETKGKLIWLRQGYLSSLGDKKLLSGRLAQAITSYMPLFRAIVTLLGKKPPIIKQDVVIALQEITSIETGIFEKMLLLKRKQINLSKDELTAAFEQYYNATERICTIIDEHSV